MAQRAFPLEGKNRKQALSGMSGPQIIRERQGAQEAFDANPTGPRAKGLRAYITRCNNELARREPPVEKYTVRRLFIGSGTYWGAFDNDKGEYLKTEHRSILCHIDYERAVEMVRKLNKEGENS